MFSRGSISVFAFFCAWVIAPAFSSGQETVKSTAPHHNTKNTKIEQQLLKINEETTAAEVRGDIPALDKFFTDTYVHFHEAGRVQHKADFLDDFKTGKRKYNGVEITDAEVHIFGTSAIIHGHEVLKQPEGNTQHGFTAIWVQEDGKWRLAAWIARPAPNRRAN